MLTPISRMRPWKLASETATLDNLSDGRVILAVGLGAVDSGFIPFGEVTGKRIRAELMDEGLDILTGLWKGQPFVYEGKHYTVQPTDFMVPPPPVQQPRIPIWMVGVYPSEKSMARAMRYDGLIPNILKKTIIWLFINGLCNRIHCDFILYSLGASHVHSRDANSWAIVFYVCNDADRSSDGCESI